MDITILIENKKESDNPSFADLKLYHKECKGGTIESKHEGRLISGDLIFSCRRCHAECKVEKAQEHNIKSEIIVTSLDGKERKITVERDGNKNYSATLVQRDPSTDQITSVPEDQVLSLDFSDE
ncbi:MAG: hypothetical protein MUP22_11340 [Desulfobacterales bacterium]|nr:hypothetical protein [Desulfobacterales bacterium]